MHVPAKLPATSSFSMTVGKAVTVGVEDQGDQVEREEKAPFRTEAFTLCDGRAGL